jgi:hypothetical protein
MVTLTIELVENETLAARLADIVTVHCVCDAGVAAQAPPHDDIAAPDDGAAVRTTVVPVV